TGVDESGSGATTNTPRWSKNMIRPRLVAMSRRNANRSSSTVAGSRRVELATASSMSRTAFGYTSRTKFSNTSRNVVPAANVRGSNIRASMIAAIRSRAVIRIGERGASSCSTVSIRKYPSGTYSVPSKSGGAVAGANTATAPHTAALLPASQDSSVSTGPLDGAGPVYVAPVNMMNATVVCSGSWFSAGAFGAASPVVPDALPEVPDPPWLCGWPALALEVPVPVPAPASLSP